MFYKQSVKTGSIFVLACQKDGYIPGWNLKDDLSLRKRSRILNFPVFSAFINRVSLSVSSHILIPAVTKSVGQHTTNWRRTGKCLDVFRIGDGHPANQSEVYFSAGSFAKDTVSAMNISVIAQISPCHVADQNNKTHVQSLWRVEYTRIQLQFLCFVAFKSLSFCMYCFYERVRG